MQYHCVIFIDQLIPFLTEIINSQKIIDRDIHYNKEIAVFC